MSNGNVLSVEDYAKYVEKKGSNIGIITNLIVPRQTGMGKEYKMDLL